MTPNSDSESSPRRRRPRYKGTHPRRFHERYKERDLNKYPEIDAHVRAKGRTTAGTHIPIMVEEVIAALKPTPGAIVADVTLGYGGHALAFLERIAPNGRLIGLDMDGAQLKVTRQRLESIVSPDRLSIQHSHFAGLPKVLSALGVNGVDIIFADLGVSSMQIDDPERGFSYKHDGPLDMRMNQDRSRTAADIVATMPVDELATALRELADEPEYQQIAQAIVRHRSVRPITRTQALVDIVLEAKGLNRRIWRDASRTVEATLHPAALTFQALRILVNEELQGLEQLLRISPYCLNASGRLGVLTFHSGEDRRVKHSLRDGLLAGVYQEIAEEPLRPTSAERHANPRSSAAKFRWAIKQ